MQATLDQPGEPWLWGAISSRGALAGSVIRAREGLVALADLGRASALDGRLEELRGRKILVFTHSQLSAALALLELDGVARRLVLCTPDLAPAHLPLVVATSDADAWVRDAAGPEALAVPIALTITIRAGLEHPAPIRRRTETTEWVLLTSGTTGAPKLVQHTLATLTSALNDRPPLPGSALWSTFYDIRRYGGLQIFLRAMHTGSLVLSDPEEPVAEFLLRARAAQVTHISGTPSHWRRALMTGAAGALGPRYVRLSGEIADQGILDNLRDTYPQATVAHAFASTEAGVAFEVGDGRAGFPVGLVGPPAAGVELRIADGTLQIRSPGNAVRYLGSDAAPLRTGDGFVDTGDRVELREGRYHFIGRAGGVINIGGLKVYPEEIEAVINAHPWVKMSLAKARRNPITGAVVTADVVLAEPGGGVGARPAAEELTREIVEACKRALAPHKVPALIRFVPGLEVSPSGKLVRPNA